MSSNSSVSTDALEQSAMSFLGEYLGHFPFRGHQPNNGALIAHFDQVAKDLFANARECLAASDLLRSGRAPVPTPMRKLSVSRKELKSGKVIPCAVAASEVHGVPSYNCQSSERSAVIEIGEHLSHDFYFWVKDLWTGKSTRIHIRPESEIQAKAMADILRGMAKALEANGERADYRRRVPSDRLCRFCNRATVRPGYVSPGSPEDAHRDLHYCMKCKAYLDTSESR